jgi:hypothetical protein
MLARAKPPVVPNNWYNNLNSANTLLLAAGNQTSAHDYLLAQQPRNMLIQHLAFLFKKYPELTIVTLTTLAIGGRIAFHADLKHGITDGNTSLRNMEHV